MSDNGYDYYDPDVLDDDALRELAEVSHELAELERLPAFQTFKACVEQDFALHQRRILEGAARSMEDYRFETGYIAGAMAALRMPERLRKRYEGAMGARAPEPDPELSDDVYAPV